MDPRALLESVAEAYRNLKTLQGHALSIGCTEDEGTSQRSEARLQFFYAAPARIRIEQPGRLGSVLVSDGLELKSYFVPHRRYFRNPAPPPSDLPGVFMPELPWAGGQGPFLFGTISGRVQAAEILPDEPVPLDGAEIPCHGLSVTYEPSHAAFSGANRPVRFWIDARSRLVLRMEGEVELHHARDGATTVSRRTLAITRLVADAPIPAGVFEFTPPEGTPEHASGSGLVEPRA
jgi:outer membrane lipoprotein-sorting protein